MKLSNAYSSAAYCPFSVPLRTVFVFGSVDDSLAHLQRTEKHVQHLNDSQHSFLWWKSIHVLSVLGAIAVHRAFVANMQNSASSASPAALV